MVSCEDEVSGDTRVSRDASVSRKWQCIGRIARGAAVAGVAAALAGCGSSEAPVAAPSFAEDLAAIAAFNARYLAAINAEDIAALSRLTTEGHIMLAPNRPPLVGKTANDEANGRAFEQFDFDETWTPVETEVFGDFAYQRGTYVVVATPRAGGDARELRGHFLRIYERQPNGEWRMIRDMFNSDGSGQNN